MNCVQSHFNSSYVSHLCKMELLLSLALSICFCFFFPILSRIISVFYWIDCLMGEIVLVYFSYIVSKKFWALCTNLICNYVLRKKKVVVRYGKDLKLWILEVVLMLVLLIPGTNYWCSFSYVLVIAEIFFISNEFDMYYVRY